MCSATHLLQYIEIRAYLIPKVFHQQDLIGTLEWRGASLRPIDPWEVCSPPYVGYRKTGLSWHPFYFLPSTSATPDFRCLVGPTACTNLCLPRVSALVNLTVKSSRLTLKIHQANYFLTDKHTNDRTKHLQCRRGSFLNAHQHYPAIKTRIIKIYYKPLR